MNGSLVKCKVRKHRNENHHGERKKSYLKGGLLT